MSFDKVATKRSPARRGMTKHEIRSERRLKAGQRMRIRKTIYSYAGGLLALALVAGLILPSLLPSGQSRGESNVNNAGPVAIDADDGATLIGVPQPHSPYSAYPATSGWYWFESNINFAGQQINAPLNWGEYDFPLPDEAVVGNLFYGGIAIFYDCQTPCPATLDGLRELLPSPSNGYILAPKPGLANNSPTGEHIVITSWRHRQFFNTFDRPALQTFIDAYFDRAPQSQLVRNAF